MYIYNKLKNNQYVLVKQLVKKKDLIIELIMESLKKCKGTIIFLCLKDGRRIPLTPSNQLNDLLFLEGRAIFIAKLLKVDLKLNNR